MRWILRLARTAPASMAAEASSTDSIPSTNFAPPRMHWAATSGEYFVSPHSSENPATNNTEDDLDIGRRGATQLRARTHTQTHTHENTLHTHTRPLCGLYSIVPGQGWRYILYLYLGPS